MTKSKERIELELPSKAIHVSHATCANGCNLMDETITIKGYTSIHAHVTYNKQQGSIYLDPFYGSFENICEIAIPEGEIVELFCPKCGISLTEESHTCTLCSAPIFVLHLPKGAVIEACLRKGCFEHTLKIVQAEELLKRLFDEHMLDAYL